MISTNIPGQLWTVKNFFSADRFQEIRNLYRKTRINMSMTYDDRILTAWSDSPELQEITRSELARMEEITKQKLEPQVTYASIDLSGSAIMMHRLHPDIFVQVQVVMSDVADVRMEFAFCVNNEINQQSEIDYRPLRRISRHDVELVPYEPNVASVYVNDPRGFVGMLGQVPPNSVREVLVLSYTRLN
jgi:hypothetical protein